MHLLHTVVIVHRLECCMKAGPSPRIAPVNPAFTFNLTRSLTCVTSADAAQFLSKKLKKLVGQAKEKKDKKHKDEDLHLNGLFCQLVVLTLQCCCVPCASGQANQWLLTVTHSTPDTPRDKTVPFVYLCCVMSVLNLNSLLSNRLNYCRVLLLYTRCDFHWLKL